MKKAKTILLISALLLTLVLLNIKGMAKLSHGLCKTKEYRTWQAILTRCRNTKTEIYQRYGAKGITVCQEWTDSFLTFLNDMGPAPSPRHSIDRIDNKLGYSPGNCRWADAIQQNSNRSNNIIIEFNGVSKTLTQWGRDYGIGKVTIYTRYVKWGWSFSDCLKPVR